MEFPTVQKVENLHHHKSVKNEREMSRVDVQLLENVVIILLAINKVQST